MRRLAEMIQEATVDCYNESEQLTGLFTMARSLPPVSAHPRAPPARASPERRGMD